MNENSKKRYAYIDIAKGIGVILVVWGHTGGPMINYINQFHMPFFFVLSGLVYSNQESIFKFTVKKIRSLYIPFIVVNGISFLLTEFLKPGWLKKLIFMFMTLTKFQEFGPTWFLGALLWISISYRILDEIFSKRIFQKARSWSLLLVYFAIAMIGFIITFPYLLSRIMVLSFFFALGVAIKPAVVKLKFKTGGVLLLVGLYLFLFRDQYVDMAKNEYSSIVLFMIGSFYMSTIILSIAKRLELWQYNSILQFLGKRSLDVLLWHFLAFKPVICLQLRNISMEMFKYSPIYSADRGWWILYLIFGLAGSCLIGRVLDLCKSCCLKLRR